VCYQDLCPWDEESYLDQECHVVHQMNVDMFVASSHHNYSARRRLQILVEVKGGGCFLVFKTIR